MTNAQRMCSVLTAVFFLMVAAVSVGFAEEQEPLTSVRCNQFTFDATGSYDPDNEDISFRWDFGDGTTSQDPVVTHTYKKSGDYTVVLTITDKSGSQCSTASVSQKVRVNIPPFATFNAPEKVCVNQPVVLDGRGSYDDSKARLGYKWDFGDGQVVTGKDRVTKIYKKGGKYKVSLTVDDNSGAMCHQQVAERVIEVNEPPVAKISQDEILKCAETPDDLVIKFSAAQSTDVNNDRLTYLWDFGDGTRAEGVEVVHRYQDWGNYDVKLIVKDDTDLGCGTSVDFVTVKINKAPVAEAGDDIVTCVGDATVFDGKRSYAGKKGVLTGHWTFGDGEEAEGLKVEHVYNKPGKYQATLSVENKLNAMCPPARDTRQVEVNSAPSVAIKASKAICLGETIEFDATSGMDPDGDPLEYYWSFGDGVILKDGPKVSHTYEQGGEYRVTVIADDGKGSACSTATASVTVKVNTPPAADAGPNTSCCVDKAAEFNASASSDADGDRLSYTWDFGDGTTAHGAVAQHTYRQSGSYQVKVTVDDNSGTACSTATAGFVAEVNASPVPVINIR